MKKSGDLGSGHSQSTADIIAQQKKESVRKFFDETLPDNMSTYVGSFIRYIEGLELKTISEDMSNPKIKQGTIGGYDVTVKELEGHPNVAVLSSGFTKTTVTLSAAGKEDFVIELFDSFGFTGLSRPEQSTPYRKLMEGGIILESEGVCLLTNEMGTWHRYCAMIQPKGEEKEILKMVNATPEHVEKACAVARRIDTTLTEKLRGFPEGMPMLSQNISMPVQAR